MNTVALLLSCSSRQTQWPAKIACRSLTYLSTPKEKLAQLRAAMANGSDAVDAFVIPSEDAHQSEYTADCDNRRAWISGFTGSAGCAVVTRERASLFTDGRYFLQASQELDASCWTLMKQGEPGVPTWQEFLMKKMPSNSRIGVDPSVLATDDATKLARELSLNGSSLVPVNNLIDAIRTDRPPRPANPIKIHDLRYAGKSISDKINELQEELANKDCHGTVISALDEIAWLLNMRGSDIHCCPVFFAYCVVTRDRIVLYTANQKLSSEVKKHLSSANVEIRPYDKVQQDLHAMPGRFLVDPHTTSYAIFQALGQDRVHCGSSFIARAKAIKNSAELTGIKRCHKRDGAAVSKHFAWLAHRLRNQETTTELDAITHLEDMRKQHDEYVGPAFDTIAASGSHGAIIHYTPDKKNPTNIDAQQLYLCDSGAQYKDGTTDITRTFLFDGEPNKFQKQAFTSVLQSHIALDQAIFPQCTTGYHLDPMARAPLWRQGLDFRHGTGHGVGAYLNVHEGPHGIGSREAYRRYPLEEGMLVTNEPGYYQDGEFGIRIENVLAVRKATTPFCFGDRDYLGFEHVTFVPLGRSLIHLPLLSDEERAWINQYHEECRKNLEPWIKDDQQTQLWVEQETEPL